MESFLTIAGVVTATLSLLAIAYFVFALERIRIGLMRSPRARAGLLLAPPDDALPSVCVVIPAHNEERVIHGAVQSVLSQDYPKIRLVCALDRCTDRTRAIIEEAAAGDDRVEIIEITQCPPDWAGKTNALRAAVESTHAARTSDLLLFVDADTELHPQCVRASVGLLLDRRLDLLSLLSTLSQEQWFERIVQPMTVLELLREHPLHRVNRERRKSSFANGQYMLFQRTSYEKLGGHERVKEALLEDLAFARALKNDGGRWGAFIAGEMLRCRMYGDWAAFRRGWKRIFIDSVHRRPKKLRQHAALMRTVYIALPLVSLAALTVGVCMLTTTEQSGFVPWFAAISGGVGVVLWLAALTVIYAGQGASLLYVLTSPIGAWLASGILCEAAADLEQNRGVSWGGRVYTNLIDHSRGTHASDA